MRLREIEVVLGEHAHADALAGGLGSGLEHEAVVAAFLQAAQVERSLVFVAHHEAEGVDIERAAFREVAHREYDMACAGDGEAGSEDRFRYGHRGPQSDA